MAQIVHELRQLAVRLCGSGWTAFFSASSIQAGISRASSSTLRVRQASLRRSRARPRHARRRKAAGRSASGRRSRPARTGPSAPSPARRGSTPARCTAAVPSSPVGARGPLISSTPATRAEPKSMIFTVPVAVDHDVLRTQVLVQHLHGGGRPAGPRATCSTMPRTVSRSGCGWSRIHCASVCPSMYSVTR